MRFCLGDRAATGGMGISRSADLDGHLVRYRIHMKRTNLVLDEELLEEAVRVLGVKTYSATVNLALKEALRMRRIQGLADHIGNVEWLGDLSKMRADSGR